MRSRADSLKRVLHKVSVDWETGSDSAVWAGLKFMLNAMQCVLNEGERRLACLPAGA